MKIGVLTFHRCINYGSYWQARCLAEGLRSLGHDAVILDHDSARVNLAEWKCALRPTPDGGPDRSAYRRKTQRFFRAFEALPLSPRFPVDQPERMPHCDAVVVGSDEVWNLCHPWYGGCPLFYGEGIRTPHLVAYAASFGNYDAGAGLARDWSQRLHNFRRIAVRDENSRRTVERAIGTQPDVVLDPCLQFSPATSGTAPRGGDYVVVYGHGFSPPFSTQVRRWARSRQATLVSIGYRNDWADEQWIDAGPDDFATCMAGARAVATNFFHGCVFALRHRKPFACERSWYRSNKVQGLMAQTGAERHLMDEGTTAGRFDAALDAPPSTDVQDRIGGLRRRSRRYLGAALAAVQ